MISRFSYEICCIRSTAALHLALHFSVGRLWGSATSAGPRFPQVSAVADSLAPAATPPVVLLPSCLDRTGREKPMSLPEGAIVLQRGGGRRYEMGALWAVFKADE